MTKEADKPPLQHPTLGTMRWNSTLQWWYATLQTKGIRDAEVGIAAAPDFEKHLSLAVDFLNWIQGNLESFLHKAAIAAFNYDLIMDDELTETQLESMLKIDSVNVHGGLVHVWLDAGGATTDHLVQTLLDDQHAIVGMGP